MMLTAFERGCRALDAGRLKVAFNIFKKAAESGDVDTFNNLGYCYGAGKGVKKNFKKAMYWYKKAVRSNQSTAVANIGTIYRDRGNRERAIFWFKKAMNLHDDDAALELAKVYLQFKNKSNIFKAKKYLRRAVKGKYISEYSREEAAELLKDLK